MTRLIEIQRYNPYAEQYGVRRVPLHLRLASELPIGLPFLVDVRSGRIIPESLSFSIAVGEKPIRRENGRSGVLTAQAYHYPMRSLCNVAREAGVPLRHLDEDVFAIWLAGRVADGCLKRQTIVDGINATGLWLGHMADRHDYAFDIDFDMLRARTWGLDSLYDGEGRLRDTRGVDASRAYMMRTLSSDGWRRIEAASGPPPALWRRGGPSSRPRLAHLFGLDGGCRLIEATSGIHADAINAVRVTDPDKEYPLDLRASKNLDGRQILLPAT